VSAAHEWLIGKQPQGGNPPHTKNCLTFKRG
jgi:hypothetical protein